MQAEPADRRPSARERRRRREREIVAATRELFDERREQDARVERIARRAGMSKGLIYRSFASKEELFSLTAASYLEDLGDLLADLAGAGDPVSGLREACERTAGYCISHPAFIDCTLSLARRPSADLRADLSDGVWLRLGRATASCVGVPAGLLRDARRHGAIAVEDPDFTAARMALGMLGTMHLARAGALARTAGPGLSDAAPLDPESVAAAAVADALAVAGVAS